MRSALPWVSVVTEPAPDRCPSSFSSRRLLSAPSCLPSHPASDLYVFLLPGCVPVLPCLRLRSCFTLSPSPPLNCYLAALLSPSLSLSLLFLQGSCSLSLSLSYSPALSLSRSLPVSFSYPPLDNEDVIGRLALISQAGRSQSYGQ